MKKPWTRIIRFESYGNIITRKTDVDNIALDWVYEIINGASGRPDDMKIVLDQKKIIKDEKLVSCLICLHHEGG